MTVEMLHNQKKYRFECFILTVASPRRKMTLRPIVINLLSLIVMADKRVTETEDHKPFYTAVSASQRTYYLNKLFAVFENIPHIFLDILI